MKKLIQINFLKKITMNCGYILPFKNDDRFEFEDDNLGDILTMKGEISGWDIGADNWLRIKFNNKSELPFLMGIGYGKISRDGSGLNNYSATEGEYEPVTDKGSAEFSVGYDFRAGKRSKAGAGIYYNYQYLKEGMYFFDPAGTNRFYRYSEYPVSSEHRILLKAAGETNLTGGFAFRGGITAYYGKNKSRYACYAYNNGSQAQMADMRLSDSSFGAGLSLGATFKAGSIAIEPYVCTGFSKTNKSGDVSMKTKIIDDNKSGLTRKIFFKKIAAVLATFFATPFFSAGCNDDAKTGTTGTHDNSSIVYKVMNGNYAENISKLFELMGGVDKYIAQSDVVVIKGNAQWPNQGYTHTGCIKAVIDEILAMPGFYGEIIICDNIQSKGLSGDTGFDATSGNRVRNWPDHNWTTLAAEYSGAGKPVSVKRWTNQALPFLSHAEVLERSDRIAWVREFFEFHGMNSYLSYPVFESPLNSGRIIDLKNGVWESGSFTGRRVRTIFMPTLNNHGWGSEDYAGITSAVKCFFGATEIHNGDNGVFSFNGTDYHHIHSASYTGNNAFYAGELAARYMSTFFRPALFKTAAMWSGHESRTGGATETKTTLACENPVTLDYVACSEVIAPYAAFLDPDIDNNTRKQILGCLSGGIGTIDENEFSVVSYDFALKITTSLPHESPQPRKTGA